MQFQIPQFIETEDKILGPLSLKQLLYLAGAGVLSFLSYFVFAFWAWTIITLVLVLLALTFAFVKYNGRPLVKVAVSAMAFVWKPRLFLWKRQAATPTAEEERLNLEKNAFGMPSVKKLLLDLVTRKSGSSEEGPAKGRLGQEYSVFRKITGEKEVVKRIDYR